jgi:hypothetical protein
MQSLCGIIGGASPPSLEGADVSESTATGIPAGSQYFSGRGIGRGPEQQLLGAIMGVVVQQNGLWALQHGYGTISFFPVPRPGDEARALQLKTAGYLTLLVMYRTGQGPCPISPLLPLVAVEGTDSFTTSKEFLSQLMPTAYAATVQPWFERDLQEPIEANGITRLGALLAEAEINVSFPTSPQCAYANDYNWA